MRSTRKFPSLAAAALVVTAPLSLALAAGLPLGDEPPAPAPLKAETPEAVISRAEKLLNEHKPVAARALLVRAVQQGQAGVTGEEKAGTKAMTLLARANSAIHEMDPIEVSLQKAEVAIADGDVRIAERQVQAVLKSAAVTQIQSDKAHDLAKTIEARRQELSPAVPEALAQAESDFKAGRVAQAKAGFEMVERSGVALNSEQQSSLDNYQMKLVALASQSPELFANSASMAMLQPGVVKRRDDPAPAPAPAPAEAPKSPAMANDQPPPATPAPAPKPKDASQDKSKPAPPAQEDPIHQAQRFEAQNLLAQADKSFDDGRMNEAQSRYFRLQSEFHDFLTPAQLQHIQDRLQESKVRMGAPGTAPRPEEVMRTNEIARQQAIAEFNSDLDESKRELASGDVAQARTAAARARLRISTARGVLGPAEYETMNQKVSDQLTLIDKTEAEISRKAQEQADKERAGHETEVAKIQRAERERKIVELIDRARAYQMELRYPEALEAVNQLLFIDPINPTGLLLKDVLTDIIVYRRYNAAYDHNQASYSNQSLDNLDASEAVQGVLTYPADWAATSIRRGEPVQFAEAPENRKVLGELNSIRVPTIAFNNNPLQDATQFLATITHQNIDVDWTSLENASINRDTPVTLNLTNVTAKTALDRLIEKVSGSERSTRADWAVFDGVVTIASDDRIRKNTALVIYDVRDLLIEVPDYRDVPRIDLQQALQAAQSGGGGGGGKSPFKDENERDQQQQQRDRDQRLDDLISIITNNVDYDGWADNGGDTGKIQKMANAGNLIITNTPKNQRAVAGLLSKLREIRAMQINVETRFLLVNQAWFEQIGFDLDVYLNAKNNQVRAARVADPTVQASDFFNFNTNSGAIGPPTDGLQRNVSGATTASSRVVIDPTTGLPTNVTTVSAINQGVVPPNGWSPIGFVSDSLGLSQHLTPQSGFAQEVMTGSPALGIAGQFMDDVQVDFLIKATQADRRTIQLTAPRLTFTNGQTANIYVATQTAFISDLMPVVGDSAVGFDPTVGVVTEGVTLLVEGTVTADRRYVQMNVDAGVARVDGFGRESVSAVAGGQLVSSATVSSFIELPQITVTRVRTTVTVPDQGTILMGGERIITDVEVETGVPVLSKVPILNRFFTNRIQDKEEQTLLILMKPTILIQNEEEEQHFPGLLQSIHAGG